MRRRRTLDDRSAEALLSGRAVDGEPELSAFVAAMSAQVVAAPPSAALAALLADGLVPDATVSTPLLPARPRTGVRRWALQLSLGTAACVAMTVGAASNDLPAPVQRTVADVVEALTPLTVPRPDPQPEPAEEQTHDTPSAPKDPVEPSAEATESPSDDASEVPREHRSTRTSERTDDGNRSGDGQDDQRTQPDRITTTTPPGDNGDGGSTTSRVPSGDHPTSASSPSEQPDSHESPAADDHSGSSGSGSSGSGSNLSDGGSDSPTG